MLDIFHAKSNVVPKHYQQFSLYKMFFIARDTPKFIWYNSYLRKIKTDFDLIIFLFPFCIILQYLWIFGNKRLDNICAHARKIRIKRCWVIIEQMAAQKCICHFLLHFRKITPLKSNLKMDIFIRVTCNSWLKPGAAISIAFSIHKDYVTA